MEFVGKYDAFECISVLFTSFLVCVNCVPGIIIHLSVLAIKKKITNFDNVRDSAIPFMNSLSNYNCIRLFKNVFLYN